jgi:hypothetical protein
MQACTLLEDAGACEVTEARVMLAYGQTVVCVGIVQATRH